MVSVITLSTFTLPLSCLELLLKRSVGGVQYRTSQPVLSGPS